MKRPGSNGEYVTLSTGVKHSFLILLSNIFIANEMHFDGFARIVTVQ